MHRRRAVGSGKLFSGPMTAARPGPSQGHHRTKKTPSRGRPRAKAISSCMTPPRKPASLSRLTCGTTARSIRGSSSASGILNPRSQIRTPCMPEWKTLAYSARRTAGRIGRNSPDSEATEQARAGSLPTDFGFVIDVHAHEPETIYVVPIKSDGEHFPIDGKLRVYRSKSGGNEWEALTKGLPQKDCYVNILRDAMAVDSLDKCGVYFGTTGGQVYGSADAGDSWTPIVEHLPAVLSVEVQTLP